MARYTQQTFIDKATMKHSGRYCYKDVVFLSTNKKVVINCQEHGPFEQLAGNHLRGDGCKLCNASGGKGVYSPSYFEKWPEECIKPAILYVLQMSYNSNTWIKVGITVSTITDRFSKQIYKEMDITCMKQLSMNLHDAFIKEQQIITDLQQYKFSHNLKFCGHTECFYNIDEVHEYIKQI